MGSFVPTSHVQSRIGRSLCNLIIANIVRYSGVSNIRGLWRSFVHKGHNIKDLRRAKVIKFEGSTKMDQS